MRLLKIHVTDEGRSHDGRWMTRFTIRLLGFVIISRVSSVKESRLRMVDNPRRYRETEDALKLAETLREAGYLQ